MLLSPHDFLDYGYRGKPSNMFAGDTSISLLTSYKNLLCDFQALAKVWIS